jgi:hypothetical protein
MGHLLFFCGDPAAHSGLEFSFLFETKNLLFAFGITEHETGRGFANAYWQRPCHKASAAVPFGEANYCARENHPVLSLFCGGLRGRWFFRGFRAPVDHFFKKLVRSQTGYRAELQVSFFAPGKSFVAWLISMVNGSIRIAV